VLPALCGLVRLRLRRPRRGRRGGSCASSIARLCAPEKHCGRVVAMKSAQARVLPVQRGQLRHCSCSGFKRPRRGRRMEESEVLPAWRSLSLRLS